MSVEARLRTRVSDDELAAKVGKIVTDDDYNLLLTGPARLRRPDGALLAVYLPGALLAAATAEVRSVLSSLKTQTTNNRGAASGMRRVHRTGGKRSDTRPISSAVVGAMDPVGPKQFCRLTAWTGRETENYRELWPFLRAIGERFAAEVPDRYAAQMKAVRATQPEWLIPDTPFTTVTVNNTYPTGVHKDAGDLDAGFSTLACLRSGSYTGGVLVWPEYRVAVDLHDGDLVLMDAHAWHGNTRIVRVHDPTLDPPCSAAGGPTYHDEECGGCQAERITVVAYYRTKMQTCGSAEAERLRAETYAARFNAAADDDLSYLTTTDMTAAPVTGRT